jgi:hypothetical protein
MLVKLRGSGDVNPKRFANTYKGKKNNTEDRESTFPFSTPDTGIQDHK